MKKRGPKGIKKPPAPVSGLSPANNLSDVASPSTALGNLGGAKAGVNTDSATPSFTPTAQIAAEMCDFGVVALPGVAVSPALTAGTTYPAAPIAQPDCPRMLQAVTSNDFDCSADLVFIVSSKSDVNQFTAACTIPGGTPGGTTITFTTNNNVIPVGTILSFNCSAVPPAWLAGSVTFETNEYLQIFPFNYYKPSGVSHNVQVQGEWFGSPTLPLVNDGTVGTVARGELDDGVRPIYAPAHVTGTDQIKALFRVDLTGAGGSVGAHAHNQKAS